MTDSELIEIFRNRRSVRKYTNEPIPDEKVEQVLKAGLMAASGKSKYPFEFILVKDRDTLEKMSHCRVGVAKMLKDAFCAIVVVADNEKSDTCVEDSCFAMANMHVMASALGIGSCWIQSRNREAEDGRPTEEYLREILSFPGTYMCLAMLSMGMPAVEARPHDLSRLHYEKIHRDKFTS